ncbi:MAG: hypothetical protein M1818_000890 [Claussenomyces sp. TS43310]|nr:MAG: hypothetical protein M1818_000890 [Claussenomyces sp. TS43310]
MSLWQSFKSLSPRTRLAVGCGLLAWGVLGPYMSDAAEKKLGFEPSQRDKDNLEAATPKIRLVERD